MADERKDWEIRQANVYTKWCNMYLQKGGFKPIEQGQMHMAFVDGIKLMQLVSSVYNLKIPKHNKKPKMRPQKIDNIVVALDFLTKPDKGAGVKTNFLKQTDLADGNFKMVAGMVWAIILDYNIKGIQEGDSNAKDALLLWCNKKTKGYKGVDGKLKNFARDWKDGLAFNALIHSYHPDYLDYDGLDPQAAKINLENAFNIAEEKLGIMKLLDPDDLLVDIPDSNSVITYVSELYKVLSALDSKERGASHLANFINFTRNVKNLAEEYERRARAVIVWIERTITGFQKGLEIENPAQASEVIDTYKAWVMEEKPKQVTERIDLEGIYSNVQTQLSVNGRKAYQPPEEITPEAIGDAFEKLASAEADYAKDLREGRFKFIKKLESNTVTEEQIKEFEESFDYFDKDDSKTLELDEFKAAMKAAGFGQDDTEMEKTFEDLSTTGEEDKKYVTKEAYIAFLVKLYETADTPEAIIGSAKILGNPESITKEDLIQPPMTEEDAEWLLKNAVQNEDGTYDITDFIEQLFSGADPTSPKP